MNQTLNGKRAFVTGGGRTHGKSRGPIREAARD